MGAKLKLEIGDTIQCKLAKSGDWETRTILSDCEYHTSGYASRLSTWSYNRETKGTFNPLTDHPCEYWELSEITKVKRIINKYETIEPTP
jgi:hypothetical protein